MGRFAEKTSDPIFKSERVFREEYTPEQIHERDEEIKEYEDALAPIIRGQPPKNIFLIGKSGVGKTLVTDTLISDLKEDAEEIQGIDLTVIELSCRNMSSSYQVATNLVNEIHRILDRDSISTTGYPKQDVFQMLYDGLDEIGGTILIILDEIDNIGQDDAILYELPRATANKNVKNCEPAVIGISNDFRFRDNLSPEAKDTLCDEEIQFAPYNANELKTILSHRVEKGFKDGVIESGVVDLAAALAAKDKGSARQGLRLLYKAGEIARDKEDMETVNENHVRRAEESLVRGELKSCIRDLTTHGHLVLLSIMYLESEDKTPARTKNIYDTYIKMCKRLDIDSLVQRRMYDHLIELERYGLLDSKSINRGGDEGRYYKYGLDVSMELSLNALSDVGRIQDALRTVENKYKKVKRRQSR